jgi:hypothetical protein
VEWVTERQSAPNDARDAEAAHMQAELNEVI